MFTLCIGVVLGDSQMQINSINSVNFKGHEHYSEDYDKSSKYYDFDSDDSDVFDSSYEDSCDEDSGKLCEYRKKTDFSTLQYGDNDVDYNKVFNAVKKLKNTIKDAKNNVHPFTVVTSILVAGFSAITAKKNAMPIIRKTAVTVGEYVSKGAVKVFSGVTGIFGNKVDTQSAYKNIVKFADKLRSNGENIDDTKMLGVVQDFVEKSTDKATADRVVSNMKKCNIKTPAQLFDVGVAAGAALFTGDVVSDRVEQHIDNCDIGRASAEFQDETGIDAKHIINEDDIIDVEAHIVA